LAETSDESTLPDAELVRAAVRRQAGAFEALVERYQGLVKLVAFRHIGFEADAADAAQEAFVRAYFSMANLKEPGHFRGWLLKITANVALDIARKRGRRPALSLEENAASAEVESAARPSVASETVAKDELRLRIAEAIESLPEDYRMVAVLRYLEDLPYSIIAARLGVREDTLRTRMHRANAVLRDKLRRYVSEE
jgi:RNA polymerase sigma-70 factor (ECF subfamily)